MAKPKILVITSTVRANRSGRKIADWYITKAREAAPQLDFELLDIADLNLTLFAEAIPPAYHQYSESQNKIAAKVGAADGFIFVTGEYNHTIPGALKNFLDYVSAEWHHKVAAYVGYGTSGAIRAIEHLIQIMAELRSASLRDHVYINVVWEALDEKGIPKPGYVFGDINAQLKEFTWWVNTLKAGRTS